MTELKDTERNNGATVTETKAIKYVVQIMYDGASPYIDRKAFDDVQEADAFKLELEEFWKHLDREVSVRLVSRIEIIKYIDVVIGGL